MSNIMLGTNFWVVIPVYNCANLLREAVNSVLNQPYKDISIIIVDDGSIDGTADICDELESRNERIHVIHQENRGISLARNAGIEYIFDNKSDGYVIFLDADDCWKSNFFTDDFIETLPEVDVVRFLSVNCNYKMSRCKKSKTLEEGVFKGGKETVHKFLFPHIGAAMYSVGFLKEKNICFIPELKYSEDVLFVRTTMYNANEVAMCNSVLYLYRNNPTSCVHSLKVCGFDYFEPMFKAYLKYDFDGKYFIAWYLVDSIIYHFRSGRTILSAKQWLDSHKPYVDIARKYGGKRANKMLVMLEQKPFLLFLKYRMIGIAEIIARQIIGFPLLKQCYEKVKYPIKL